MMVEMAADFCHAAHADAFALGLGFDADSWQRDVLRWRGDRLLMNCCRQSGKSTVAAILALHTAMYARGSLTLLLSPSQRQSGELFRKVVDLMGRLDPRPTLDEETRTALKLDTGSRIVSLPGSEGTIRGYSGVDLLVVDEAARVPDEAYKAVRPMLAVSGGRLVTLSTPWGKRGWWHREWTEGGDTWKRVRVPAEECPRISPEFLEEERRSLGDLWFRSEYLCEFTENVNAVFGHDLITAAFDPDVAPLWGQPEAVYDDDVEPLDWEG